MANIAAQKIAPKSSQELVEVHGCGRQHRVDGIAGDTFQPIPLLPVFRLQMSDAGFDGSAAFHPAPQPPRGSAPPPLVDMHRDRALAVVDAIAHVHMRLTDPAGCIAERRALEVLEHGEPMTDSLHFHLTFLFETTNVDAPLNNGITASSNGMSVQRRGKDVSDGYKNCNG